MIRLAHPLFTRDDLERLWPVLESGMLVQGSLVAAFEAACAEHIGVARTVAVSSGTAALHVALRLVGVAPGREVVLPAFGWPSAANVTCALGGEVRFVDIDPETYAIDSLATAEAVGPATAAVVPIHPFGQPLEAAAFGHLAEHTIVEDAACAFGAADADGRRAGTWGRLGIYSLHARKGLTTGEGGLLTASSSDDLDRLARARNLGLDREGGRRVVVEPGLNYRLTELAAALGLQQLGRYEQTLGQRRRLAARYRELLPGLPGVNVPAGLADPGHVVQALVISVSDCIDRNAVIAALNERGVESTVGTIAAHMQPYYAARYELEPDDFPVARWAHEKTLALPLHEQMSEGDVETVVETLSDVLTALVLAPSP